MDKTILYIEKFNSQTKIHFIDDYLEIVDISPLKYINSLCLKELTTLDGRIEAIKINFNIVKNVPIYITDNLILFKINNKNKLDNIYINSVYIKHIIDLIDYIKIVFYDEQFVLVKNNYHIINNTYEKCLKIKKQINQFY